MARRTTPEPGSGSACLPSTSSSSSATRPSAAAHLGLRNRLAQHGDVVEVPLAPFLAAGALLYQGPWVAERLVEFGEFLAEHPDEIHPVVRAIFEGGRRYTAVDAFAALQRLEELKAEVGRLWQRMDVLVVPTVGTTFTVAEVLADPVDDQHEAGALHALRKPARPGRRRGAGRDDGRRPTRSALLLGAAQTDDTVLAAGRPAARRAP